ncbi:Core-2/I-Branching enzyme [Ancylostoma ceylanicum]|uniref:Core-2/I-Branching enzyme n=1 Tax=Ancylostoma ceylanicum TaxID=53326 RepID=A0A0D6M5K1_9BILA|nr:Core-2/I-Branching enzyme [Ancylostoma ceylanicum]
MLYFKNFVFNAEKSLPLLLTFTFYLLFRATVKKTSGEFPCDTIHKYFFFEKEPLSLEEQAYPLSYGLVIYKDIVQVLLELSIFYQPQNVYCITVDQGASKIYKKFVNNLPKCFNNIKTFYLSGTDLPLRTNLEMVRIMKALNGSINTDVEQFEQDRYRIMEGIHPPVPLYKSAMSVAIPRRAANFMIRSKKVKKLLNYLSHTWIPDESFWTSVAGNAVCEDINRRLTSWSCVFGVMDMPEVVKRPELVAHKMYLDTEPAAFICLLKEIRRRSRHPVEFDAQSYAEMPTVELSSGKRITELTHPEWLMRSSFYRPPPPLLPI